MTATVLPFGPSQAAVLAEKEFATLRARAALLGAALYRRTQDGVETYVIGLRRFESLDQVEDFLDRIEVFGN